MKTLKMLSLISAVLFFSACAHHGRDHSCCSQNHGAKVCKTGQCKKDSSCCENKCGKCEGNADDCSKGNCDSQKKS